MNIDDYVYEVLKEILQKHKYSSAEAIERAIIYLSDFLDGWIYDNGEDTIKRAVVYHLDFVNGWKFNMKEERIKESDEQEKCESKSKIDLDPEFKFMIPVKLHSVMNMFKVNFNAKTERNQFVIKYSDQDNKHMHTLTITFKQVKSDNLTFAYGALRNKIKGYLVSVIKRWYPQVRVTAYRDKFVEQFIEQFIKLAPQFAERRIKIEDELGPLPHAFSTFLELKLPRTMDGLYIINGNALKMYNAKAKNNRWAMIRNLGVLSYMISQKFPELKCSTTRKQYCDIDGKKKRGIVLVCDLYVIAHKISSKLDELM